MPDTLYIIAPCYNEEEVIASSANELNRKLVDLKTRGVVSENSRILFVDDGSSDNTWKLIKALHSSKPNSFYGVKLSRNQGQQAALLAGLKEGAKYADLTITLDVDLQDDIAVIDEMIANYKSGDQIVYGVRSDRSSDSNFKRASAEIYYKFTRFGGAPLVFNHAEYRLMSKKAMEALFSFPEVNLFLRGMVPLIGYQSSQVFYSRKERTAGVTKYPLSKMIAFGWEGITSFSGNLFKLVIAVGGVVLGISAIMFFTALFKSIGIGQGNWILVSLWFLMGLQIIFLGVIGEYIGKTYLEAKRRPIYIVEETASNVESSPSTSGESGEDILEKTTETAPKDKSFNKLNL